MKPKVTKVLYLLPLWVVFILISLNTHAQNVVHLQVLSSVDGEPVSFALIEDRTYNDKFLCDEQGEIDMVIEDSTLIRISALSYHDHFIFYHQQIHGKSIEIKLLPKIYELDEFVLNPYATVALFKKAVLELQLEDSNAISAQLFLMGSLKPFELQPENFQSQDVITIGLGSPISALYNLTSKRAKSEKRYRQLTNSDKELSAMQQKYNKEIVMKLTGLKESERLDEFMEYCKPSIGFILRSSDYELALLILQRYDTFLLNHSE